MSNPVTVIANAIAEFMAEGDGGQDGALNLVRAEEVIRALRRGGYTIARLSRTPTG